MPSQNIFRQKATMEWFSRSERATANGIAITCLGLVPFIFTPLATYLVYTVGYHWSIMLFIAGTIVILVGIALRFLYKDPKSVQRSSKSSGSMLKRLSGFGTLLKNRNAMLTYIGFSASGGTMQMATAWGITYLRSELGLEPMVAAAIMMTWSLAGMFRPLGGIINDRIFKGRRKLSCVPSALFEGLICLTLVILPRNTSIYVVGLIFFFLSFSRAMWGASGSIWGAELVPLDLVGSSVALQGLISGIVRSTFPFLIGWIVDVTGSFTYGWLSVALIELAVTVPAWAMVKEDDSK
jgi:sugar phosphate permease